MPPKAILDGHQLVFKCWGDNLTSEQVQSQFADWLNNIKQYLGWQDASFGGFNQALSQQARQIVEQRKAQLLRNQNLVSALGIPLKRNSASGITFVAPEVKRKLSPKLPPATAGQYKPEPILEENEYKHILGVIDSMGHVMECSPGAFHNVGEESLRVMFLVPLNSHYEGQATGETFNSQGKTDILIRSGDRNIFIAECKFWDGPSKLLETIDQLLGYLSWRDSKAAIIIFNRNKDFSKVLTSIPETVKSHANFQKDEGKFNETSFRYVFRHKDDPAKMIHITVMSFDVPQEN